MPELIPDDIITLIYQYKTAILVHEINTEIIKIQRNENRPRVITLTPANKSTSSIGVIYNTQHIVGATYKNVKLNREFFRNHTYFCEMCGEWLRYKPLLDAFVCTCDYYLISRY